MRWLLAIALLAGCGGSNRSQTIIDDFTGRWTSNVVRDYALDADVSETWTFIGTTVTVERAGDSRSYQYHRDGDELVLNGQRVQIEEVTQTSFVFLGGLNRHYFGRVVFNRRFP